MSEELAKTIAAIRDHNQAKVKAWTVFFIVLKQTLLERLEPPENELARGNGSIRDLLTESNGTPTTQISMLWFGI